MQLKRKQMMNTTAFAVLWIVLLLALLSAGTYAWFTVNRINHEVIEEVAGAAGNNGVSTSRAGAVSGSDGITLQLGTADGDAFEALATVDIRQVNTETELMPVSTADLQTFVCSKGTVNGNARGFVPVEDEQYYYHGRLYLRAVADDAKRSNAVALYLEETDGALAVNAGSESALLTACRLGLDFHNGAPVLLSLSDADSGSRRSNSYLGDVQLTDGQVLSGTTTAVEDPSQPIERFTAKKGESGYVLPESHLFTMQMNEIYPVDIYFYMEGCDPDCTNALFTQAAEIYLGFYAVVAG